jgi:protein transport protein SEC20
MDEVSLSVENLKKEWDENVSQLQERIRAIENCRKSGKGTEEANALPRLNGAAEDGLASLQSMQFRLDLLVQQLPTMEEVQSGQTLVEIWKEQYQKYVLHCATTFFFVKFDLINPGLDNWVIIYSACLVCISRY